MQKYKILSKKEYYKPATNNSTKSFKNTSFEEFKLEYSITDMQNFWAGFFVPFYIN